MGRHAGPANRALRLHRVEYARPRRKVPTATGRRSTRRSSTPVDFEPRPAVTTTLLEPILRDDMLVVDRVLRESLASDVALIRQISEHIVGGGGKRLRPALLLLTARACGYTGKHHHTLAAVVEMIHTSTLLHDDVVEFQLIVSVDSMRALHILSDATNVIAEGEVLQLMNSGNPDVEEVAYLDVIRRKTAKLFEAAAQLGAMLAGADPAIEDALARYGAHLGTAFQLIDDVLDYSGDHDAIGKNLGDDLAEGKPTLPLIRAMQVGSAADAALIRDALERGRLDDFKPVVEVLARTDALDYAHRCAQAESAHASACLDAVVDSPARQTLLKLAAFAVERTY